MKQDPKEWDDFPGHDAAYWQARYHEGKLGWDLGKVSPPLQVFFDGLETPSDRVFFPGAGQAWEAAYLHEQGFSNVHVLDWAPEALAALQKRVPDFPSAHLHQEDFFAHQSSYDLIVEQTFFCAIPPPRRSEYLLHAKQNLVDGGRMVGLLFDDPLNDDHPPYGGSKSMYHELLAAHFSVEHLQTSPFSIGPRAGRELFFIARKQ